MNPKLPILLILLLSSCHTQQHTVSTSTHVITRTDTLISFAPDTASLRLLLECDSIGQIYIRQLQQEQGTRLALQAQLTTTQLGTWAPTGSPQSRLCGVSHSPAVKHTTQTTKTTSEEKLTNAPQAFLLAVDCHQDSLQALVNCLREQIISTDSTTQVVQVPTVPRFYKVSTALFYIFLTLALLALIARILIRIYLHK